MSCDEGWFRSMRGNATYVKSLLIGWGHPHVTWAGYLLVRFTFEHQIRCGTNDSSEPMREEDTHVTVPVIDWDRFHVILTYWSAWPLSTRFGVVPMMVPVPPALAAYATHRIKAFSNFKNFRFSSSASWRDSSPAVWNILYEDIIAWKRFAHYQPFVTKGNPLVIGGFPSNSSVMQRFDDFYVLSWKNCWIRYRWFQIMT